MLALADALDARVDAVRFTDEKPVSRAADLVVFADILFKYRFVLLY